MYKKEYIEGQRAYHKWRELCDRNPRVNFDITPNPYYNKNPSIESAWYDGWNKAAKSRKE